MASRFRMFWDWVGNAVTKPFTDAGGGLRKFFDPYRIARRARASKVVVTDKVAESYSACWHCTSLISDTIAMMPRSLKLKTGRRRRIDAENHPFYDCWIRKFNPTLNAYLGHAMLLGWAENFGDAFAIKKRDSDGRVYELWPVHPTRVPKHMAVKHVDGTWTYAILPDPEPNQKKATPIYLHERDLFHYTGRGSDDGRWGKGLYEVARESIGTATAANDYAGSLYGNGLLYGVYLTTDQNLSDEKYEEERQRWEKRGGLTNAHKPLLLDMGQEIKQASFMSAQQAQMIESREFNAADMGRFYGVPAPFLNVLLKGGKPSPEDNNILVTYCLLPRIVRYVLAHETQCLGPRDQYRYVLQIDHRRLMFGNVEQRRAYLKDMFSIGVYDIDEVREWEGEDPVGGKIGRYRFVPANVVLVEHADAQLRKLAAEADKLEQEVELGPEGMAKVQAAAKPAPGPEGKPPGSNDNAIDGERQSGDGTEGKAGDVKIEATRPAAYLEDKLRVLALNVTDWEAREVTALSADPRSFRQRAELFYRGDFTRAVSNALILRSGESLGDSAIADVVEPLIQSRLADLEDLYDRPLSEFAPAVAFRLASEQPRRVAALREVLAGPTLRLPTPA